MSDKKRVKWEALRGVDPAPTDPKDLAEWVELHDNIRYRILSEDEIREKFVQIKNVKDD